MFGQRSPRDIHRNRHSSVRIGVAADMPVVTLGNIGTNGQAQSQTARLARNKRHHEAVDFFLSDLGPVVNYLNAPVPVFGSYTHTDFGVAQTFNGIGLVLKQVEKRNIDFPISCISVNSSTGCCCLA